MLSVLIVGVALDAVVDTLGTILPDVLPFNVVVLVPVVEPIAILVVEPAAPLVPRLTVLVSPDIVAPA